MSAIAYARRHPSDEHTVVIVTPPGDGGNTMAGFQMATYSPMSKGYLMAAGDLDHLRRWLVRKGTTLVDERNTDTRVPSRLNPGPMAHDCGLLGCRSRAITRAEWAEVNPEADAELRAGSARIQARTDETVAIKAPPRRTQEGSADA